MVKNIPKKPKSEVYTIPDLIKLFCLFTLNVFFILTLGFTSLHMIYAYSTFLMTNGPLGENSLKYALLFFIAAYTGLVLQQGRMKDLLNIKSKKLGLVGPHVNYFWWGAILVIFVTIIILLIRFYPQLLKLLILFFNKLAS